MDTLTKILDIYHLTIPKRMPIEIPDTGRADGNPSLATLYGMLDFKIGVEVGTERGKFAEVICKSSPNVQLYCVDMWQVYPGYRDYNKVPEKLVSYEEEWAARMLGTHAIALKGSSAELSGHFPDGSLDFVYIDANHELKWVIEDIWNWSRKVRTGGIISGHDYYETKTVNSRCHVVPSVIAYTRAFWVRPWFVLGTKGIYPGIIRDRSRSWMWVKDERQP